MSVDFQEEVIETHVDTLANKHSIYDPTEIYSKDLAPAAIIVLRGIWTHPAIPDKRCPYCNQMQPEPGGIVVSIDGHIRNENDPPASLAAFGIWFGQDNELNLAHLMRTEAQGSYERLQIMAASLAISQSRRAKQMHSSLHTLIVKTSSSSVYRAMTTYSEIAWRRELKLHNTLLLQLLDKDIAELSQAGMKVLWWLVPEVDNQEVGLMTSELLNNIPNALQYNSDPFYQ